MARRAGTLDALASEIESRVSEDVVRAGIDGVDGAGKTVFADELADHLRGRGIAVLRASVDGFHHPRAVRHRRGRDSPEGFYTDSYDLDALHRLLFAPLAAGAAEVVTAIHDVHEERAVTPHRAAVPHPGVLVFDGIFLHRPELRDLWDVSVWLDVPFEVSTPRGAARGYGEPDPAAASNRRYVEGQRLYIDACAPSRRATFVVDNTVLPDAHIVAPQDDVNSSSPDGQQLVRDVGPADAATVASLLDELGYPVDVAKLGRRPTVSTARWATRTAGTITSSTPAPSTADHVHARRRAPNTARTVPPEIQESPMRAVAAPEYGGPDVLELRDVDDPKVGPDYVLVRVDAASVNPVDYKIIGGKLDGAFPVVWPLVPGWDVAGEVIGTGPAVRHVEEGQRVFGYARKDVLGTGTWAEQVAVPARAVAPAPEDLDAVAASCLPLAGMTAWQSLVEDLDVGQADTVLIHGATGGVGHLATQIAVARGARVIGTCSEPNHDFLRELGGEPVTYGEGLADHVRELAPDGVDAVADFAAQGALEASDPLLRTPGRVVSVLDPAGAAERGGTYVFVRPEVAHLTALAELADAGSLTPHVQSVHDLDAVRAAVTEASSGSVRGKVVLRVP